MSNQNLSDVDEEYDLRATGAFKIGRSPLCNLTVSDSHVSKVHCSFNIYNQQAEPVLSGGSKLKVLITDHSSNGTWIISEASNKKTRLEKEMPTLLKDGDNILLTRSTDISPDVISYRYVQSPFPRVMKSTYKTEDYGNQGAKNMLQCDKKNVAICEEIEQFYSVVREEDGGSKPSTVLEMPCICMHEVEPSTKSTGSIELKKFMDGGGRIDKSMNKDTQRGIEIQTQNIERNDEGKVGNTTTTMKPSHLDQRFSSPRFCKKQDGEKTFRLKRKSESGDDFVWTKKVRFKEQMDEKFEQRTSHCEGNVKNKENSTEIHVEDKSAHSDICTSFDVVGNWNSTPLKNSREITSSSDNGRQETGDKNVKVKACTTTSLAVKEATHCDPSTSESSSELPAGKTKPDCPLIEVVGHGSSTCGIDAFADGIQYGECFHCGKQIPQVTISLHETVCEGLSQEAKSHDHVSLLSLPLESCLPGDQASSCDVQSADRQEDSEDKNEIECNEENKQLDKTNNPEGTMSEVNEKKDNKTRRSLLVGNFDFTDDLGNCVQSEINDKHVATSCTSGNVEGDTEETISGSTEQQTNLVLGDPAVISPNPNQPTLEKEESKERCTFCSAVLSVSELVVHISSCSKTSAVARANSEDLESLKEACPYCADYFDVLALVDHVERCKNLSMIKAVEISREDCSQSSHSDSGSHCLSGSEDDSPTSDKELCPKCNGEFSLLQLLIHADNCQGERPKACSGVKSQGTDVLDDVGDDVVDDESKGGRSVVDRPGREDKIGEKVESIEGYCDERHSDSCIHTRTDKEDIDDDGDSGASEDERLLKVNDCIKRGDDDHGSTRIDRKNSICKADKAETENEDDKGDLASGDHYVRLDESSVCEDEELYSSEHPRGDGQRFDKMGNSEGDADFDQFEICPSCRKLFHLSLLVEHAAKCTVVSLDLGTTTESKTEFSRTTIPTDSSKTSPIVFTDCSVCGVRLPVHMMGIHYPRCLKRYASKKGSEGSSQSPESDPADFPEHVGASVDNFSSRVTVEHRKNELHHGGVSGDSAASFMTEVVTSTGDSEREADKLGGVSLKRTHSSLDSYRDCEEQCDYCFKMFAVSVLVKHVEACATLSKATVEDLEQCCYCLQTFPLSELIKHTQNCEQKTVSGGQVESPGEVSSSNQSSSTELLERCMYCFKDFPVSKLIRHAQTCDGDMSGPRERFQGFLPSIHDLSAISSVAILNENQRAALQYVISRSAQESEKVSSGLLARVQRLGYSENDLKRTLQWVRSAAPIIIHINLDKVLRFLVKDTHYRNQFETGTSGGSTDLGARKSWENRIFNSFYKKSSPSERVKYGVLNIVGDPCGVRSCIHYGDSFLQLKKVRLRTTFASMDTSGAGVKLSCCEHYENVMYAYGDPEITAIIDVATGKVPFHRSDCISQYKEVQIHGPVSLSENVECIVVNARHKGDPRMESLLDLFVEQNKCNLIWMDPDDFALVAPPLLHGALGHHLAAGSPFGPVVRRRSLERKTPRKRRRR